MSHTEGKWIVEGSTVYQLMHDGWRKGKEQFRNKYYFRVEVDYESEQNGNAVADRLVTCWNEHDDLVKERDELVKALRPFAAYAAHYPLKRTYGNRPTTGEWHSVESGGLEKAQIDVEDFHNAAALVAKYQEQS